MIHAFILFDDVVVKRRCCKGGVYCEDCMMLLAFVGMVSRRRRST